MCELSDVSAKEKHFYLLWNQFMQANPIISQISIPRQCSNFVRQNADSILEHGLEEQLIAHLTNLWYEGVIAQSHMLECMDYYNKFVDET